MIPAGVRPSVACGEGRRPEATVTHVQLPEFAGPLALCARGAPVWGTHPRPRARAPALFAGCAAPAIVHEHAIPAAINYCLAA